MPVLQTCLSLISWLSSRFIYPTAYAWMSQSEHYPNLSALGYIWKCTYYCVHWSCTPLTYCSTTNSCWPSSSNDAIFIVLHSHKNLQARNQQCRRKSWNLVENSFSPDWVLNMNLACEASTLPSRYISVLEYLLRNATSLTLAEIRGKKTLIILSLNSF